jgi:hypothetical protein
LIAVAPFIRYLPIFGILKILNEGKRRSDDTSSIETLSFGGEKDLSFLSERRTERFD